MVVAVFAGMATPSGAATTSAQRFIINGQDDDQFVFGVGGVSGAGQSVVLDEDNDLFVFPNGTFKVFHPQTGGSDNFNEVACVGTASFTGTFTLMNGTGAYAGISGSGTYSGRAVFFSHRTADGCAEEGSSVFFVNATGTTTLP